MMGEFFIETKPGISLRYRLLRKRAATNAYDGDVKTKISFKVSLAESISQRASIQRDYFSRERMSRKDATD